MSDIMLHGVLNMPVDLWCNDDLDKQQRHGRYTEASERIKNLNMALLTLVNADSNWAMNVSDNDESLIRELINIAESV